MGVQRPSMTCTMVFAIGISTPATWARQDGRGAVHPFRDDMPQLRQDSVQLQTLNQQESGPAVAGQVPVAVSASRPGPTGP